VVLKTPARSPKKELKSPVVLLDPACSPKKELKSPVVLLNPACSPKKELSEPVVLSNTTGDFNSFFGEQAGSSNTTGDFNSFFGERAGVFNTTGEQNSFFGQESGNNNSTGDLNSFFGRGAGRSNTIGSQNSFFGRNAGHDNINGFGNAFFGENSGQANTSGTSNSFFGHDSGFENTTGGNNAFFGNGTGRINTSGENNAFFGAQAGQGNTEGEGNTFLGYLSGAANNGDNNAFVGLAAGRFNEGSRNIFLGRETGRNNNNGSGNIFIGDRAGFNESGSNKLYIANSSTSSPLLYGEFDNSVLGVNGSLGVGIQNPERPIHLRSQRAIFRIDRDRADPGFAVVRYDQGFQNVWKSFYFYTLGSGVNQGKFIIADWGTDVAGPDHLARLTIDNEGDIGIGPRFENLNNNATAKLHVDGTVRFENLPNGRGDALVIDANGNISRAVSTAARSDLQAENEKLKNRVEKLEQALADIQRKLALSSSNQDETPAQLFQNQPNPSDGSTVIPYFVSDHVSSAQILISDLQGRPLKKMSIQTFGEGSLDLRATDLPPGIYLYTLVVDGAPVDSKRMVIQ
ncbi:MAG: T9SS type A sorting domain-containing protein, partial [Bacteroidota bacterium]